jgi:hypothetical protein
MGAIEIVSLVDLLLTAVEKLGPRISQLVQKGEITVEQQIALIGRIASIQSGVAFQGDHWKPKPPAVAVPPPIPPEPPV